jgi:hypothetical protein
MDSNEKFDWESQFMKMISDLGLSPNIHCIEETQKMIATSRLLAYVAISLRRKLKPQKLRTNLNMDAKIISIISFQEQMLSIKEIENILFVSEPDILFNKYFYNVLISAIGNLIKEKKIECYFYKYTCFFGLREWFDYSTDNYTIKPKAYFLRLLRNFAEY